MKNDHPKYDRSFLPDAQFEFVVLTDTHFILDPEPYAVEFDSVREWPQRGEWAWRCVAALSTDVVIHLGDLTEENAIRPQQPESRRRACEHFERHNIRPKHVAGNMDIGDKPDATMWTEWVTPQSLGIFHEKFGRSWYSFDHQDLHFVVLNSQIMNGPLPQAEEQQAWLEADLAEHKTRRLMMFMHMPPFFVDENEPDTGFYNSINEPARSWITGLMREYEIECLFTGHTHFRAFSRVDESRFYVCPSATTSRAGFSEAFSVAPAPDQGRNDPAKLGFYLVRVYEKSHGVYFLRTQGQTEAIDAEAGWQRLICRKTRDFERSPFGAFLRTPLAYQSAGALAWPGVLRQGVRDDHPMMQLLEAGVQHVRVPVSDLGDSLQGPRLQMLRDEGVGITAIWLWSDRLDLSRSVGEFADGVDVIELQIPGERFPAKQVLQSLADCGAHYGKSIVLTPVIAKEASKGKYHPRTRFGYRVEELAEPDLHLEKLDIHLDRVFCHIDLDHSPWDMITEMGEHGLDCVDALDYVVRLPGADERGHQRYVVEALLAAALQPGCRVFFDPFVDLYRTNDLNLGLLDRLSNPRAAYVVMQCLNTLLFSQVDTYSAMPPRIIGDGRLLGIEGSRQRHWFAVPGENGLDGSWVDGLDWAGEADVVDLVHGLRQSKIRDKEILKQMITDGLFMVSESL
jgi:predicted phosphodiesterase